MKKRLFLLISSLLISNVNASVPYCVETTPPPANINYALQTVVTQFAQMYACQVGNNCLLNFDQVKYSVAWKELCAKGYGTTFICENHSCHPYGMSTPRAPY